MTRVTALVVFAVQASVFLNALALGMRARADDATYLARRPGLLGRSLLAMNVIMPAIAVAARIRTSARSSHSRRRRDIRRSPSRSATLRAAIRSP